MFCSTQLQIGLEERPPALWKICSYSSSFCLYLVCLVFLYCSVRVPLLATFACLESCLSETSLFISDCTVAMHWTSKQKKAPNIYIKKTCHRYCYCTKTWVVNNTAVSSVLTVLLSALMHENPQIHTSHCQCLCRNEQSSGFLLPLHKLFSHFPRLKAVSHTNKRSVVWLCTYANVLVKFAINNSSPAECSAVKRTASRRHPVSPFDVSIPCCSLSERRTVPGWAFFVLHGQFCQY